jgi:ADP-ribose pyrophosphatase YjhB (NUDIX family)
VSDPHHYSVSVAAAVVREDGKVLAIRRRDNGRWEPPGGVLEAREIVDDGLRREVYEETGLTVRSECLTGIYQNMQRDILALVFRCVVETGDPKTSDESTQVQWLSRDEVTSQMTEAYAVRVTDALDFAGEVKVRPHDGHFLWAMD